MQDTLVKAKDILDNFHRIKSGDTDIKTKELAKSYLEWVGKKTGLILNEKNFTPPPNVQIKRGEVFWIEFGYNIDQEYGGRHPGIILRVGGNTAIVLPLSTQEPQSHQLESGAYVEIDRVYGLTTMKRWVNVLNATPVSIQRFDYSRKQANVKGYELDKISLAMEYISLWKVSKGIKVSGNDEKKEKR